VADWVWEVDAQGVYTYSSEKSRDLLGLPGEELLGTSLFHLMPAEDARRARATFLELATRQAPIVDLENCHVGKGGRRIHLLTNGVPLLDEKGALQGYRGAHKDVTARKEAETRREQLEAQLRGAQRMEAIGSLAGGVAHDFNNLLSVIRISTTFALESLTPEQCVGDQSTRSDLQEITQATERAVALTRQLLAFGRKQVLQPVALSLNRVASGLEKMLRRILGEDIDLVLALAPDLGIVQADPGQLEQVLMNLVVNARDAMPRGGRLTIETSNVEIDEGHAAVAPGSHVQLSVTDTGCGMSEQTMARIFEPFFTTKDKGKGTGLGLPTAYGILKQSGGGISVESQPGRGTTFRIYLRRERSAGAVAAAGPLAGPHRVGGNETILLVDDEPGLRHVAKRILDASGYTVLTAGTGDHAMSASGGHAGDLHLLLTDVVMPGMSGRGLAQELSRARPNLKVLYMSGYTDDVIANHGVLDAGTHLIGKPFTASELTRKVREVLDGPPAAPPDG
jgi:PAS domain S-box-containing protein